MSTPPIVTRVEITDPTGRRHAISDQPLEFLRWLYPEHLGYRLREVQGYDAPDGSGFCHVDRTTSR